MLGDLSQVSAQGGRLASATRSTRRHPHASTESGWKLEAAARQAQAGAWTNLLRRLLLWGAAQHNSLQPVLMMMQQAEVLQM